MSQSLPSALAHGFLGQSPRWYKAVICLFLLLNPLLLATLGPVVTGWALVLSSFSPWAWRSSATR
jgi:NhaB family Na+:H+ antiporter